MRPTGQVDPWAVLGAPSVADPVPGAVTGFLPSGIELTSQGGLSIAGLEWLGARSYDPGTRAFLSTDPLAPVLGAGWDGNPYSYAGNNPLNLSDPTGLRPQTDDELKAYDQSSRGMAAAVGGWFKDNWEYVAGGLAVVGGAALMFVPGGQVIGMGLMSFGADVVIQKATTGQVNWGEAAVSGVVGMVGGGAGMIAGKVASKVVTNPVIREAIINGVDGTVSNVAGYATSPGPHTLSGFLKSGAEGLATGGLPLKGANKAELPAVAKLEKVSTTPEIPHIYGTGSWVASTDGVILNSNRARTEDMLHQAGLLQRPAEKGVGTIYTYPDGSTIRVMEVAPETAHNYDRAVFAGPNRQPMDCDRRSSETRGT